MLYRIGESFEADMKLSGFNVVEKVEDGILIYNTNSGGILKLDKEYEEKYNMLVRGELIDDVDFMGTLVQGKMLVDKTDGDEVKKIILENMISRFNGEGISLTIAPTMDCNFRCPYCYEKGKEYVTMSEETIQKMKEYIEKIKEQYKYIYIAWYGGEPLLAFKIVKELMETVYENFEKKYVSTDAVTNGYLLNEETVLGMKELNISRIQITIDGPPEIHNVRRKLPSGEDTFFVILNNMKNALKIYPELNITVRVNVDKTNIKRIDEIEKHLAEYELLGKISVYIAPVTNINETCNDKQCFNTEEFALEEINFMKRNWSKGVDFVRMPIRNVGMCGAVSLHSWLIDAKGDLYKCWDDVGNLSEKVGSIYQDNIVVNANLLKWLMYSIEKDEECMKCPYLPVCMGGCANYRIKNKEKNCHPIKENVNQVVRLVYDIMQQKAEGNA